jgi:arylformamidase
MNIIDISQSINNEMWSYRPDWKNKISAISSTSEGDASTVYKFELCSHTGTYIETSQHKLKNNVLLEHFPVHRFICNVKVLIIRNIGKEIKLEHVLHELNVADIDLNVGDSLIICTGWGAREYSSEGFIVDAPYFEEDLTNYLLQRKLSLLGVDTPVIDNQVKPYFAVNKLFNTNEDLLLLAPLAINLNEVKTGVYMLNTLPLKISGVSASLCRPVLIEL